jgi:peptide chain release factor 3
MRKIQLLFSSIKWTEGKDAFDLMDEVEQKLGLNGYSFSFPIGMGYDFKEYTTYGTKH